MRQRGVEGIISVQSRRFPSEFPMVFIDLLPVKFLEPIPVIMQPGLTKAGQEAAEHVVRRIEQKNMRFSGIGSSLVSLAGEGGPAAHTGARPQSPAHFAD